MSLQHEQVRKAPRAIPRQRTARPTRRVRTFWDGTGWSYGVEGDATLGHRYAEEAPAVAGGRYLARTLGAEHVVEDEHGNVRERVDWSESCSCHPRDGARSGV